MHNELLRAAPPGDAGAESGDTDDTYLDDEGDLASAALSPSLLPPG